MGVNMETMSVNMDVWLNEINLIWSLTLSWRMSLSYGNQDWLLYGRDPRCERVEASRERKRNKVALQCFWSYTSAWVCSYEFAAHFHSNFFRTPLRECFWSSFKKWKQSFVVVLCNRCFGKKCFLSFSLQGNTSTRILF